MKTLAQALRTDTEAICYPNGRKVGSEGHLMARQHLQQRLLEIGCQPYLGQTLELSYDYENRRFFNLVGRLPGRDSTLAPILIGAHYDSVIPFPCADDNAAAVAIALQAGHQLSQQHDVRRDVLIALFDAEEPPYFSGPGMGSIRFYEDHVLGKRDIHAAIIMDLVGHDLSVPGNLLPRAPYIGRLAGLVPGLSKQDVALPSLAQLLFVTGSESHQKLPEVLDSIGQPSGLKIVPTLNRYIGDMSDHGVFRRHGVPYFFLSCGRWAHYHAPTDTPDRLNYKKMSRITRYVVDLTRSMDVSDLSDRQSFEQTHDSLDLERSYLKRSLGLLYQPLLKWMKLNELKSRRDMDAFVHQLLSTGL